MRNISQLLMCQLTSRIDAQNLPISVHPPHRINLKISRRQKRRMQPLPHRHNPRISSIAANRRADRQFLMTKNQTVPRKHLQQSINRTRPSIR